MRPSALGFVVLALSACSSRPNPAVDGSAPSTLDYDVQEIDAGADAPTGPTFCSLAGSNVAGAVAPNGFCVRRFAALPEARVLAIAPNGDVFVAAPSESTAAGVANGPGAIVVLSDDDHDGVATRGVFLDRVRTVHGMGFAAGFLYFTTEAAVMRVPYAPGDRTARGAAESVTGYADVVNSRWTHGLAVSPGGTVLVSIGVYSGSFCPDTPRAGLVQQLNGGTLETLATGFRNPMYMRCHFADEVCLASELGDDGGASFGAREKLIRVRGATNYGFPCCSGTGVRTPVNSGGFDCGRVTTEEASFPLNDTPFGLDWERGRWPKPFNRGLFVALHGSYYSTPQFQGARIVFAATDPTTHLPTGEFRDVLRGFGPGSPALVRPADVAFSPDGRMFFADDTGGAVYWMAPGSLRMAAR